jgi:hypothetical protein
VDDEEHEHRRQVHAWVSGDALAGWHAFAQASSTNVAALLEALGTRLATLVDTPTPELPPLLRETIEDSLRIAARRSARPRRHSQHGES